MFSRYLEELAGASKLAKENKFGSMVVKGLQSLQDEFAKLGTSVTEESIKERTRSEIEELMKKLVEGAKKGDKGLCMGSLRQLRDHARLLQDQGSKKA